jgi:hypothetical protein
MEDRTGWDRGQRYNYHWHDSGLCRELDADYATWPIHSLIFDSDFAVVTLKDTFVEYSTSSNPVRV